MPADPGVGLPTGLTSMSWFRLLLGAGALLLLLPTAALADDMIMGNLGGALLLMGAAAVAAGIGLGALTVVVCLLEAWVMDRFLRLGFRRCFWLAVAANLVSMLLGLVWYHAGGQVGWKTALVHGEFGAVAWLLLRSFVITVAEETVVIMFVLRRQRDFETAFKAVAWANAASYGLLGVITAAIGLTFRQSP